MNNILIVDDEKFVRLGFETIITRSGLCKGQIIQARNGQEAVMALKENTFDLVITDIKMPMMDGISFLDTLTKEKLSDAFIVVISGYDDFSYAVETMRRGACEYLLKPIDRIAFVEMLEKIDRLIEEKLLEKVEDLSANAHEQNTKAKVKAAVDYILENYMGDINMATVSNYVSMNYTFFSESFREHTGKSFVDYVKSIRINMAKRLLRETTAKVNTIAAEVGYTDEKHFLKLFKAEVGLTPSQYRHKHSETGAPSTLSALD